MKFIRDKIKSETEEAGDTFLVWELVVPGILCYCEKGKEKFPPCKNTNCKIVKRKRVAEA